MSAHTPGPWTGDKPVVYDNNGRMVADCRSTLMGDVDAEGDYANARLIAAAPDMAVALKDAAATIAALHIHYKREMSQGYQDFCDEAVGRAYDALAKAGV